ncbi:MULTISPECIES: M3 family oligoendopeptidase [Bacillus]|uniref:Oligoendopeptidase n=1 Tax=Bacillus halotolerans TaxID=260554 RepID=A0A9Q6AAV3_9BACI|nr:MULTISPECIES: M3 family oligoendopeptidase [Bacillus]MBU5244270.1 M3 family oligoendopeptidase [Bacillus halotolerans]MEC3759157.1 M3 family oligoendopeptidase [Bacillus halotolerans]PAY12724.1 oligoendopeptidase [Bacillus sp. 7705b]PLS09223.1 oligoendopeptidase [Bacillus halotolerans]QPZ42457.1 M3 family oligoendopeptidase [Bacillus halotolerans]
MGLQGVNKTWDLDSFFKGGSQSEEFKGYIEKLSQSLRAFQDMADAFEAPETSDDAGRLTALLDAFEQNSVKLQQAGAFVSCLQAQNISDQKANEHKSFMHQLVADFQSSLVTLDHKLVEIDQGVWEELLKTPGLREVSYILNERRERVAEKLSPDKEKLIGSLAVDGYHAWDDLYHIVVGKMTIPFEEKQLSVGQAENMMSSQDRDVRKTVFERTNQAWEREQDIFSSTLNHLAGFRLETYKARGWEDVLKEPLQINRMKKETLDTMWQVITENKQPFVQFLNRKASMLGLEKLNWYDVEAPIGSAGKEYSYDEAANLIVSQFSTFGRKLSAFTEKAFRDRWIEAEDRSGKRVGGFCTSFPDSGESRIFMTFSGSASNVSTLAHELGHAFHQESMLNVRPLNRSYAMNVAETASTFAEMIVADATVNQAETKEEKLVLLEDKVQRSVAFFMNIHARFLFETRFYEERKRGIVPADRLNELMEEAQKEAFCGALGEYHPLFWASKLHFHITRVPFYNYPYTFGYLFSLGIYALALEEKNTFEEKYIALLRDTASMTVEDLAMKHLGADITKRDFWENAIKLAVQDAEAFLQMTES